MKDDTTPTCPYCGKKTRTGTHTATFRRGARVLAVEVRHRECPDTHPGPDGEVPFRFEDAVLLKANDEAARAAWQAKFGEPMPPATRPGRKPREPRTVRLTVLLTESEAERIDAERGDVPRADFVRQRVFSGTSR
jgi:hypothetical protein